MSSGARRDSGNGGSPADRRSRDYDRDRNHDHRDRYDDRDRYHDRGSHNRDDDRDRRGYDQSGGFDHERDRVSDRDRDWGNDRSRDRGSNSSRSVTDWGRDRHNNDNRDNRDRERDRESERNDRGSDAAQDGPSAVSQVTHLFNRTSVVGRSSAGDSLKDSGYRGSSDYYATTPQPPRTTDRAMRAVMMGGNWAPTQLPAEVRQAIDEASSAWNRLESLEQSFAKARQEEGAALVRSVAVDGEIAKLQLELAELDRRDRIAQADAAELQVVIDELQQGNSWPVTKWTLHAPPVAVPADAASPAT